MTAILAQLITLTTFGNEYLKNGKIPTNFESKNATFKFCNRVDFTEVKKSKFFKKDRKQIVANTPTEWFYYLKSNKCKHLRLYYQSSNGQNFDSDRMTAAFVGGGVKWAIEAIYDKFSHYWVSDWEVTKKNAKDDKIWSVKYATYKEKQDTINLQIDNEKVKEKLKVVLDEIENFARKNRYENFADIFNKARVNLDSQQPEKSYYEDLIPLQNYSLVARQIIFCSDLEGVFGGMGSWNDIYFENDEEYEVYNRLSEELYTSINEAIIAGVNSY